MYIYYLFYQIESATTLLFLLQNRCDDSFIIL